ncbi:MAG: nuclear transport factor 2 family protein [Bacteroidota bacterium]
MKEFLEKWFEEVWAKENASYIKKVFVPEKGGSATGIGKESGTSPEEYVHFHSVMLGLLKDVEIKVDSRIESGNEIAAQCTMTAKDRATGKKTISIKGAVFGKIVDGKIKHADNHFDFLHLFEGLGLLPEETFAKCLSGQKVCK